MRKADVSDFKGTVYVNIREYYEVSFAIYGLPMFEPMIAHLEPCIVRSKRKEKSMLLDVTMGASVEVAMHLN